MVAGAEAAAFDALHDGTRRRVLELLRDGERSVRDVTDRMEVSQGAVSQHLRVLREAGLVTVRPEGTRRLYRVDPDGFGPIRAWVDSFWDDALTAFVEHLTPRPESEPEPESVPQPEEQS